MTTSRARRTALPALAAVLVVGTAAGAAGPAAAKPSSSSTSRSAGTHLSVSWIEHDPENLLGLPGNTHLGWLDRREDGFGGFTFGQVTDLQCEPGQSPAPHGGEGACEVVLVRGLEDGGTSVVVDERAGTARLTGRLVVTNGGHGGDGTVLGNPPVDMTWTATAPAATFKRSETYVQDGITWRYTSRGTVWPETAVGGAIGAMGFDDDADDEATGSVEVFREVQRTRAR